MPNSGHHAAYSITSSARVRSLGGMVRPSALAVLRLMTSSYFGRKFHRQVAGFGALQDFVDSRQAARWKHEFRLIP